MTRRHRWFLPETPDVIGMLLGQLDVTLDGMRALHRWADGEDPPSAALEVRRAEHRADECKVELRRALRTAFSTPVDSEDAYMISERLDNVMNEAKDLVREAELMQVDPDPPVAAMTALLVTGVEHLHEAVARLVDDADFATDQADRATKCQRRMEKVYRAAMSDLMADAGDLGAVLSRREVYRRTLRVGEHMVAVSERVWYAVVKEA